MCKILQTPHRSLQITSAHWEGDEIYGMAIILMQNSSHYQGTFSAKAVAKLQNFARLTSLGKNRIPVNSPEKNCAVLHCTCSVQNTSSQTENLCLEANFAQGVAKKLNFLHTSPLIMRQRSTVTCKIALTVCKIPLHRLKSCV